MSKAFSRSSSPFFFSSRRRHTRLQGDWSSDVCSSDLELEPKARSLALPSVSGRDALAWTRASSLLVRSEERRVGKECRSRWAGAHRKNRRRRAGRGAQSKNGWPGHGGGGEKRPTGAAG